MDNGLLNGVNVLDLKTFDTVDHTILIHKFWEFRGLALLGFSPI